MLLVAYVAANAVIIAAYGYIATKMVPKTGQHFRRRIYGTLFFVFCALTHVELVTHAISGIPLDQGEMTTRGHLSIHVVQAVAALGFAREFTRSVRKLRDDALELG